MKHEEGSIVIGVNTVGKRSDQPYLVKERKGLSGNWGVRLSNMCRTNKVYWENYPADNWVLIPKEMS